MCVYCSVRPFLCRSVCLSHCLSDVFFHLNMCPFFNLSVSLSLPTCRLYSVCRSAVFCRSVHFDRSLSLPVCLCTTICPSARIFCGQGVSSPCLAAAVFLTRIIVDPLAQVLADALPQPRAFSGRQRTIRRTQKHLPTDCLFAQRLE